MADLLAVERELAEGTDDSPAQSPQKLPLAVLDVDPGTIVEEEDHMHEAPAVPFHAASSKKSNTIKKYYKTLFKKNKDKSKHDVGGEQQLRANSGSIDAAAMVSPREQHGLHEQQHEPYKYQQQHQLWTAGTAASESSLGLGDEGDEVSSGALATMGTVGMAAGSRLASGRYDSIGSGRYDYMIGDDGASSIAGTGGMDSRMGTINSSNASSTMGGTIKGFLGPRKKKSKQIELDALRLEMGMLQERCSAAENGLSSASHDVNALRADRDMLQQQLRERTVDLTSARVAASRAEEEVARLKALHAQVKGALQGAYSQNQDLSKQTQELESLCAAQQNSLEEAEEKYRALADSHDALRHAGLQAKAQLVTAQAQVAELRTARDDLSSELAALEQRMAATKTGLDAQTQRCADLEATKASLEFQMEGMLGRLRELEAEKQQLEARQILLQEENLGLGRQVNHMRDERRAMDKRLSEMTAVNGDLRVQVEHATAQNESLLQEKQGATAESDRLAAELRSSSHLAEALRARNAELEEEVGALREAAAKKGSPLRWKRAKQSTPTPGASSPQCESPPPLSLPPSHQPEVGPMTKQRATLLAGAATGGKHQQQQQQQQVALAGRPLTSQDSSDVTAHVTAAGEHGSLLPAPLSSDSPDILGDKAGHTAAATAGPLAVGRGKARRADGTAAAAAAPHGTRESGGFLGLGGLFGCFAAPVVREAVPVV